MDVFEFHIMEKLKTTLSSLEARNAVPVNLGIVKNEESEARIRYLFNKFEKEDGKLWNFAKKAVTSLYGRKIKNQTEDYMAICDTASRCVLNRELPEGYSLYTEIKREGIEWTVKNMDKKMEKFAEEALGYGDGPKSSVYFFPFDGFLKAMIPPVRAVEVTPLLEKLAEINSQLFEGLYFRADNDLTSARYMFDYINALEIAEETLNMNLVLPLNETFIVNVKDSEILIKKTDASHILTDEIEAYEFLRSFKQRIMKRRPRKYRIEQKEYKDFVLDDFSYSFEKPMYDIDITYLKELAEYAPGIHFKITDKEREILFYPSSKMIYLSTSDRNDNLLNNLAKELEKSGNFANVELKFKDNQAFVPVQEFKKRPEHFENKKKAATQEEFPF